jgi:C4-dicarboxylate transporter
LKVKKKKKKKRESESESKMSIIEREKKEMNDFVAFIIFMPLIKMVIQHLKSWTLRIEKFL